MNDPSISSLSVESVLRDEIRRLKAALEALTVRAGRGTGQQVSAELEAALRENEEMNRALQQAMLQKEQEVAERRRVQAALQQSEERYRSATEAARDAFITIDQDSVITLVNSAAQKLFGYAKDEMIGQDIGVLMPPNMRNKHMSGIRRYLGIGVERLSERAVQFRCRHRAGHEIQVEFTFGEFQTGGKRFFTGVARDITERKRAEALREGQSRVLEMIALDAPLNESLLTLLRCVESQHGGLLASVLLLDVDGHQVSRAFGPSLAPDCLSAMQEIVVDPSAGPLVAAMIRREPVVTSDILSDPSWSEFHAFAAAHGIRACCSRPIFSGSGKVLGALAVHFREARAPSMAELKLTELTVRIAGIAIERKLDEAYIRHLAHHDVLTGLPNRILLEDRLQQAITHANRHQSLVAVLFVDLDHFKNVNDSLGHHVGDLLLKAAAWRMQACLRDEDSIGRLGGDEFVIGLAEITRDRDAAAVADKILRVLSEPFSIDGHNLQVGCSIGIGLYPLDGEDAPALLKAADAAMYDAKAKGRANFQFFRSELNAAAHQRLLIANELRHALIRNQLQVHYQPQVSLTTGAIVGVEALLRWSHPSLGLIAPAQFIAILEDMGMMGETGAWVLRMACAQNMAWQNAGLAPVRMAVNLSARQFSGGDLVRTVVQVLDETGLAPTWLELEITENLILDNSEHVIQSMHALKAMGVSLSLDDFGTGYSSLSYLRRFPVNRLKIDRSFVQDMIDNASAADIVGSILALSSKLGLGVVAEGVETEAQLAGLCEQDCPEMQGFLFSVPLPAPEMTDLLRSGRRLALP